MLPASDPLVPAYAEGDVVLARVEEVRPDVVHLALLPDVVVPVPGDRVTTNPLDRLTALFTPGETVLARVAWRDEERVYLRLDDIDDDEAPRPAPAILLGGPPWLVPPEEAEEDAGAAGPVGPVGGGPDVAGPVVGAIPEPAGAEAPRGVTPLDLAAARATSALEEQVRAFRERARELEARVWQLEDKVRNQRTALRKEKLRQQRGMASPRADAGAGPGAGGPAFLDPGQQFRHEVYVEWVRRIPAGQKAERPLAPYGLEPGFLPSLDEVEGVDRRKVFQVVVEVLTGLAEALDGRDLHQLREAESGNSAPLTRDGGWTAWRVALQRESPAARRLHYWRRGSEYRLARVVLHDDLRM
jgi:hypothetical protein